MLTEIAIKKIPLPEKRREVPDGKITGLYLVVQASGARSWALRYRFAGVPRKLTLGSFPTVDLTIARRQAQKALGDIAQGIDPAGAKRASLAAARAAREEDVDRIERVVALFIERHAKVKTRDWRETERLLSKNIVERWRGRRLSQITKAHVSAALDDICDRAPGAANRVFAHFRKMCRWAVGRGIIEHSPCDGLTAPSPERARERVLSDNEIRLAWRAFDKIGWPFGPICRLLLLTGCRRDEIADIRWAELDLAARTLSLPGERTKNGRPHIVPLSDTAVEIIEKLPRIESSAGFVFTTNGQRPVSGFSAVKRAIDRHMIEEAGALENWRIHDLRRTVATSLQKLGVRLEVTESVLGHIGGSRAGVVGVYQRHDFATEKRAALDAWARSLEAIVTGAEAQNVVEFALARG